MAVVSRSGAVVKALELDYYFFWSLCSCARSSESSDGLSALLLRSRAPAARNVVVASGKKIDIKKQGLESIKNAVVKKNLMGVSDAMNKKGWTDPSGRKGKVQPASLCIALAKQPGPGSLQQHGRRTPTILSRMSGAIVSISQPLLSLLPFTPLECMSAMI